MNNLPTNLNDLFDRLDGQDGYDPRHSDDEERWPLDAQGCLLVILGMLVFWLLTIGAGAWLASTWSHDVPSSAPACAEDEVVLHDWTCHPHDDAFYDPDLGWVAASRTR